MANDANWRDLRTETRRLANEWRGYMPTSKAGFDQGYTLGRAHSYELALKLMTRLSRRRPKTGGKAKWGYTADELEFAATSAWWKRGSVHDAMLRQAAAQARVLERLKDATCPVLKRNPSSYEEGVIDGIHQVGRTLTRLLDEEGLQG